jgi:hypothetical protein
MMMTQTAHPHHLLTQNAKNTSPTQQKKEPSFDFYVPVATMINLKTKPFSIMQPISTAENLKMQQQRNFRQLHLTKGKQEIALHKSEC